MLFKISYLLLSLLLMQQAFATAPVYKDSVIQPKVSRLSQEQFLNTYGTGDTTRALIQYYFKRNRIAKRDMLIWGTAGIAAGFAFDRILMNGSGVDALSGLAVGILLGSLIYVGAAVLLINSFNWVHFSRQRLASKLERYKTGKPLPRSIYRNKYFKRFLALEKQISRKEGR